MYYLKSCFLITTLHVDGEFAPLQSLIYKMSVGSRVNLESASENVLEIKKRTRVARKSIRYIRNFLSFKKVPKLYMIHSAFESIKI